MAPAPFEQDFAHEIYAKRYRHPEDKNWYGTANRVIGSVMGALYYAPNAPREGARIADTTSRLWNLMARRKFIPGGRYLYAAGRDLHQVNNCVLLKVDDSREGWAELSYRAEMALTTGAGIGVWYGDLREAGAPISRTGGKASGPLGKMMMINDMGRYVMQGGSRRSAIWAGLPWWHPDIFSFITVKDYSEEVRDLKAKDWTFPAPMDTTNISVSLDDEFFSAYHGPTDVVHGKEAAPDGGTWHDWAHRVYDTALRHMLKHGEPGFTVDRGDKSGEVLRNACTEITSADDSDICNLGSLVISRFDDPRDFGDAVRDAVLFLTAGSMYSDVPYEKVREVRERNRRLGLGIIGLHEFLIQRGVRYGSSEAFEVLEPYMLAYNRALEYAWDHQDALGLSRSKGATAIAPNGTIGIVAESTPSADPMLTAAEQRVVKLANVHGPDQFEEHIVIDAVAARAIARGVKPTIIEDAYTVPAERRLAQAAFLQRYVDHAISGTINLPAPITDDSGVQAMRDDLMKHLPHLRGITMYPDGARAGQPRKPVPLDWAVKHPGRVLVETDAGRCQDGVCAL